MSGAELLRLGCRGLVLDCPACIRRSRTLEPRSSCNWLVVSGSAFAGADPSCFRWLHLVLVERLRFPLFRLGSDLRDGLLPDGLDFLFCSGL